MNITGSTFFNTIFGYFNKNNDNNNATTTTTIAVSSTTAQKPFKKDYLLDSRRRILRIGIVMLFFVFFVLSFGNKNDNGKLSHNLITEN